ncbi:hypothetical protein BaRGS_00011253, partial [Batillaria attramentaria]
MHKLLFPVLLVASLVLVEVTCQDAMLAPPARPDEFRSPGELRRYLKALNEYYAIVGRPRFGRSVNKRSINEFGETRNDDGTTLLIGHSKGKSLFTTLEQGRHGYSV